MKKLKGQRKLLLQLFVSRGKSTMQTKQTCQLNNTWNHVKWWHSQWYKMLFILDYWSYPFRSLEEIFLNGTPFGTHFSQQYIVTKGSLALISLIISILFLKERQVEQSRVLHWPRQTTMPQLNYYKNNLAIPNKLSVHIWISFLKCHHVLMIALNP